MKVYTVKADIDSARKIVADDMILTKDMPTQAGSKMLEGYMSLFDAEVICRLKTAGYDLAGKANVGEFSFDLLGETSKDGAVIVDGNVKNPSAEIVKSGEVIAAITMDVNGSVRRAAAQNGLVSIKPTYGTVSRYGTIPVVCSGETVSIMSKIASECEDILDVIAGHDNKDGTSQPEELCAKLKKGAAGDKVQRVALLKSMKAGIDSEVDENINSFCEALKENGIEVCEVEDDVISSSKVAWNILMSSELCNNVSRYDGVKYGYRTNNFTNIDELYTNSRTEAFGELLKTAILFGSENLSTDNYMKVYDKALRVRRVVSEAFGKLFSEYDAVIMPACSKMAYTEEDIKADKYIAYKENFYTAPASITGLPAVVCGGVQIVGKAFSDKALLNISKICEKEDK